MKDVKVGTQSVRGGKYKEQKVGFTAIELSGDKIMSVDNFKGAADNYMQRMEPIICIFGKDRNDCIFEGTHAQLIERLKIN